MKIKKLLVALFAILFIATGLIGNVMHVQAAGNPTVYIVGDPDLTIRPGETNHIKLPILSTGSFMASPTITLSADQGAPFSFTKPTISYNGTTAQGIYSSSPVDLEFDVKVKETASIKDYNVNVKFTYEDYATNEIKDYTMSIILKVQEEKTPAQLTISNVVLGSAKLGSKTDISFTVKNEGELTAKSAYLTMDYNKIVDEGYSAKKIKLGDMTSGETKNISLPITILSTATTGKNTIIANFTYKTADGDALTSTYNFNINLSSNTKAPKLIVEDVKFNEGLKPGAEFTLSVTLQNNGLGTACDISASIDEASITQDGILKNYFTNTIDVSDIKSDLTGNVKIPLKVSKYATGGMKNLKIVVNYKDKDSVAYSLTESIFVDVTGAATAGTPNIVISNVKQTPNTPSAGENVQVSFDLQNKSNVDVSELKVYADNLTNATFIPVESEPYKYIDKLKGGEKVRITIPLIVSTTIPEGLNNLNVKYKYAGSTEEGNVIIPIHNVKNDLGISSMPKLIVSHYNADQDILRAGKTFNLTYDISNTNASVAAKNITVTITQADNIYTVTQGSNSFFINKIGPGETVTNTIELKVKPDAITKAYPLKITLEYEYEGMLPNKETGQSGVTKTEEINLQATENARPKVENINVYSWDGALMVGATVNLSFEFYNMGKSPLNNVIATLEGDGFTKTDGNTYYIGNVQPGEPKPVDFEVIPNVEGLAKGTLKISYEDSNGDTIEYPMEFEKEIMAAGAMDPGGMMGGDPGAVFNPEVLTAKKPILPIWAFVIVQIVIFVLFVPITRKVIINVYKSKLRKKEQEQN